MTNNKKDTPITSDNEILSILVPSHLTPAKKTDGWVLETCSEYHREANTSEEWIGRMPVTRIPFKLDVLRNTFLLDKLPFGPSLTNDLLLADALERNDMKSAKEIAGEEEETFELGQSTRDTFPVAGMPTVEGGLRALTPHEAFALHLTDALRGVQHVVWLEKESGELRQAVLCLTLKQVSYALVADSLGNVGGLGVCKRCGKLFRKRRASQPYCSANCRVANA
ncbi:MAG: hypothetical protein WBF30_07705, partial [Candidatus Acidiferrales bacterium]